MTHRLSGRAREPGLEAIQENTAFFIIGCGDITATWPRLCSLHTALSQHMSLASQPLLSQGISSPTHSEDSLPDVRCAESLASHTRTSDQRGLGHMPVPPKKLANQVSGIYCSVVWIHRWKSWKLRKGVQIWWRAQNNEPWAPHMDEGVWAWDRALMASSI